MPFSDTQNGPTELPEGYVAIPVAEDQKSAALRICVLVRLEPDPAGGHLVVLRDTLGAKVYLGCIVDASDRVHEWLELWIQDTETLSKTPAAYRQTLSNATLDERWRRQCQAFEQLDEAAIVKTGWESDHPLPTFLDISERSPLHPIDPGSGTPWKLCLDEGLLQQKDLPSYGGSLHRYLYIPSLGGESQFVPVTAEAPTNASTKPLAEISGGPGHITPLNPGSGFVLVKKHLPIDLETFIDILSGVAWDGLRHGKSVLNLGEGANALRKEENPLITGGRLFLETRGQCGRLIETFHLKLLLLADIVSSVHSMVRHLQRPLLNISPKSWQVKLGKPGRGLPFLWTAKPVLCDTGEAIELAIERSDLRLYLPSFSGGTSIYRPMVASLPTTGKGLVRIRQVLADNSDTTVVEGTFTTQERIEVAKRDLVWFRLNLGCGDINLYAWLETDSAMASGEWRFRTVPQSVNDTEVSHLRAAEGVLMPEIPFEVLPLLSSPCDLYSLAVIAVRVLLVDSATSLPVALDQTLSLAHQLKTDYDAAANLRVHIADTFKKDKRWLESLGPHHLTADKMSAAAAIRIIPLELWWTALAIVLRMFPGVGPYSECDDYGDAQQGGLHKVFEQTIEGLDKLILRTRSLIVSDQESNQEICSVIQRYLT